MKVATNMLGRRITMAGPEAFSSSSPIGAHADKHGEIGVVHTRDGSTWIGVVFDDGTAADLALTWSGWAFTIQAED